MRVRGPHIKAVNEGSERAIFLDDTLELNSISYACSNLSFGFDHVWVIHHLID